MIDHVSVKISDYSASREFYEKVLAPLGFDLLMEFGGESAGFGRDGQPQFWIVAGEAAGPIHIAFMAADRFAVDAFLQVRRALETSATPSSPRLRPQGKGKVAGPEGGRRATLPHCFPAHAR